MLRVSFKQRILLALLFLMPLAIYYLHPYDLIPAAILILAIPYIAAVLFSIKGRNRRGNPLYQFVWFLLSIFIAVFLLGSSGRPYVYVSIVYFILGEFVARGLEKSAKLGPVSS